MTWYVSINTTLYINGPYLCRQSRVSPFKMEGNTLPWLSVQWRSWWRGLQSRQAPLCSTRDLPTAAVSCPSRQHSCSTAAQRWFRDSRHLLLWFPPRSGTLATGDSEVSTISDIKPSHSLIFAFRHYIVLRITEVLNGLRSRAETYSSPSSYFPYSSSSW